jgi:hypothetical protein
MFLAVSETSFKKYINISVVTHFPDMKQTVKVDVVSCYIFQVLVPRIGQMLHQWMNDERV